jgi:subtilisin-like proprotein convertase family protein
MSVCNSYESNDVPLAITSRGEYLSYFEYTESRIITDLNVDNLLLQHEYSPEVDIKLISPQGTEIILYEASCFDVEDVHISFDDEALNTFPCPANDGNTYQPIDPLSAFDGENAMGQWTLKLTDRSSGDSGELVSWGLTICASRPIIVPTMGQWAILVLLHLIFIVGITFMKNQEIDEILT